jgi:hypothetical protein
MNQSLSVTAVNNTIDNNQSVAEAGGLNVEFNSVRSLDLADQADLFPTADPFWVADAIDVTVSGNVVRNNTSGTAGAGAVLRPSADADPFGPDFCFPGEQRPAVATIDFVNNLLEGNVARGTTFVGGNTGCSDPVCEAVICSYDPYCCEVAWDQICADAAAIDPNCDCGTSDCCLSSLQEVIGAGVLAVPAAKGEAIAAVEAKTSTVASNVIVSDGFVGGVEVAAVTRPDCFDSFQGAASLSIDSSIVFGNDGAGIGGPVPDANLDVVVQYSDVFANVVQNYESTLFPEDLTGQFGNISEDPLFVGPVVGDYHITADSPAVDAGNPSPVGLPAEDFEGDPRIVDGDEDGTPRVDMGHDEFTCLDGGDGDGDGFSECQGDCDDDDPAVYPEASEVCNGIDDDCNGLIDDACTPPEISLILSSDLLWPPNHRSSCPSPATRRTMPPVAATGTRTTTYRKPRRERATSSSGSAPNVQAPEAVGSTL